VAELAKQRIEAELRKDQRMHAVVATVTEIETGSFRIEIQLSGAWLARASGGTERVTTSGLALTPTSRPRRRHAA